MSIFADLRMRVLSAILMAAVGLLAVWLGGFWFLLLLSLVGGLMLLELTWMLGAGSGGLPGGLLALIGGGAVFWVGYQPGLFSAGALLIAPLLGMLLLARDRWLFLAYGLALLLAVAALYRFREADGLAGAIWLVLVVVAADIGGYFFGRILGGPKILPRISPKKTWSGTLGGWLLAALVGLGFSMFHGLGASGLVLLSVLCAIASQLGDVAESAIKRHAGVKDSSRLIPGHGGFLDRFDALIAASLFVGAARLLFGLPLQGAV